MATYDSVHTGEQVDNAVDIVLGNKSKGSVTQPIYLDANGVAQNVTVDANPTDGSAALVKSGGVFTQLSTKLPFTDVNTTGTITTSNTLVPSCGTVESYVEGIMSTKQDVVSAGAGIVKDGNNLSIDLDNDFMTTGKLDNKWSHFTPELEVGYGQDLVEEMKRAKRSSFDLSKFTVVGSPTISKDGIASGFSSSNYLNAPISFDKPFKLLISFTTGNNLSTTQYLLLALLRGLQVFISAYGTLIVRFGTSTWGTDILDYTTTESLTLNTKYIFELEFTGTKYNVKLNGELLESVDSTSLIYSDTTVTIGTYLTQAFSGSIDLKQFSITVDGQGVFNGNKTGIDIIKPDDYTTNGTPTISADGIARITQSDAIYSSTLNLSATQSVVLTGRVIYNPTNTAPTVCRFNVNSYRVDLNPTSISFGGSGVTWANVSYNFVQDDIIDFICTITDTGSKLQVYVNGNPQTVGTGTVTTTLLSTATQLVFNNGQYTYTGSIDLNAFKIYVDGNLIYQPCLKIPYTQTIDGKKIVDPYYRLRVEDGYNQAGYTPYYTLDTETRGNYRVVGSPTINSDWVASGFSTSSYIKASVVLNTSNYKIKIRTIADTTFTSGKFICRFEQTSHTRIIQYPNAFMLYDDTEGNVISCNLPTGTVTGDILEAEFTITTNGSSLIINNITQGISNSNTSVKYCGINVSEIRIGYGNSVSDIYTGSIDLKEFKIYVDNKLAYQAVIPPNYTTASVRSTAQQLLASTYSEDSTQFLRQHGACTSGTAITLPKPYMDTNYFVSVPTSAKSKTGFTPTVTGDYIAEGYTSI